MSQIAPAQTSTGSHTPASALDGRHQATGPTPRTLRLFGVPTPDPRAAVSYLERLHGTAIDVMDPRDGEVWVTAYRASNATWRAIVDTFRERHGDQLFSVDGSTVDDIVADRLAGHQIITAESCTGGLVMARLTARPGSSAYVVACLGTYAVDAKLSLLGVPKRVISEHGVVSPETAQHMAKGALTQRDLFADTAIAITGLAGPGGGSPDLPVGTVCLCAMTRAGASLTCQVLLPGGRDEVRNGATTLAMHMIRVLHSGDAERIAARLI